MAGSQAEEQSLARVYAEAVFGLAAGRGVEHGILEELARPGRIARPRQAPRGVLASPLVDPRGKRQLIEKGFRGKASDLFVDTLQVLRSKGRLGLVAIWRIAFHAAWIRERERGRGAGHERRAAFAGAAPEPGRRGAQFAASRLELVEKVDPGAARRPRRAGRRRQARRQRRPGARALLAAFAARGSHELPGIRNYINNSEELREEFDAMRFRVDEISSVITEEIQQYRQQVDVAEVGKSARGGRRHRPRLRARERHGRRDARVRERRLRPGVQPRGELGRRRHPRRLPRDQGGRRGAAHRRAGLGARRREADRPRRRPARPAARRPGGDRDAATAGRSSSAPRASPSASR